MVILTGGEPLLREDIYELAAHGAAQGHRMVMAVNGTLLTPQIAGRLKAAGVQRLSISLDGAAAASHDRLRAVPEPLRAPWPASPPAGRRVCPFRSIPPYPGQPGRVGRHSPTGHRT